MPWWRTRRWISGFELDDKEKGNPALDRVFSLFGGDALRQAIAWMNYGFLAANFFAVHQRSCLVSGESLGFVVISVPKKGHFRIYPHFV